MLIRLISEDRRGKSLIFIFLGWGMDTTPFRGLSAEGYSVAVSFAYDGSQEEAEQYRRFINDYEEVNLFAWSYGVAVANRMLTGKENVCIAINGSVTPKDDRFGIPERIFNLTLRSLSAENMKRFYAFTGMGDILPERDLASLRPELEMFGNLPPAEPSRLWTAAYVGMKDRIIPPGNQISLWEKASVDVRIDGNGSHLPDFKTIFGETLIDKSLVKRRFTENTATYEIEAEVQRTVASNLYAMLKNNIQEGNCPGRILEIGCGTGFLTRLYSADYPTDSSTVIDLAEKEAIESAFLRAGVGFRGTVIEGDAEEFLSDSSLTADTIMTSSAIQWFTNLPKFFSNIARILHAGGTAAIATYISGTFSNIPGRTLHYHTKEQFIRLIPEELKVKEVQVKEHTIRFSSAKELLTHIRHTGVNAVTKSAVPAGEMRRLITSLDSDPELTFSTLYLILKKEK